MEIAAAMLPGSGKKQLTADDSGSLIAFKTVFHRDNPHVTRTYLQLPGSLLWQLDRALPARRDFPPKLVMAGRRIIVFLFATSCQKMYNSLLIPLFN